MQAAWQAPADILTAPCTTNLHTNPWAPTDKILKPIDGFAESLIYLCTETAMH